jgi:hypothetical protein
MFCCMPSSSTWLDCDESHVSVLVFYFERIVFLFFAVLMCAHFNREVGCLVDTGIGAWIILEKRKLENE